MKKSFDEDYFELKSEFLHALANPIRLKILSILENKEVCVNELSNTMNIKQPNISQHLNILKNSNIIKKKRKGKSIYYYVIVPKVYDILNNVDFSLKK